jgi:hypothetical protein
MRALVLGLTLLVGGVALAQPTKSGDAQRNRSSRANADIQGELNAAVNDFKNARYNAALTEFRVILPRATAPKLRADLLWNIARSLEELGRNRDALDAFERFGAETKSENAAAKITKLAAIVFGSVAVNCGGVALMVRLDGQAGDAKPCPSVFSRVEPGSVLVIGEMDGQESARALAKVIAGQSTEVQVMASVAPQPVAKEGNSILGWALGSAVVVGVGVGLYFLLQEDDPQPVQMIEIIVDDEQMGLTTR